MSISSATRKAGPYNGNGSTTNFSFSFKVLDAADVLVVKTSTLAIESNLTIGVDYSVSLNANQDANPGGSVTCFVAPANGERLTLTSAAALLQPVAIANLGAFYPDVLNNALDRLTIYCQQLNEQVNRCIKSNISTTVSSLKFPTPVAGNLIGWDGLASQLTNYASQVSTAVVSGFMTNVLHSANLSGFIAQLGWPAFMQTFLNTATVADARTSLGLGTAATLDVGTTASKVVQLDSNAVIDLPLLNTPNALIGNLHAYTNPAKTQVYIGADELVFTNPSTNGRIIVQGVGGFVDVATYGVSGLDTGSWADAGYFLFLIYDGSTMRGIASLGDIPSLPTGYTHYARIGWVRRLGTGLFRPFVQKGNQVRYLTPYAITGANGTYGTGALPSGNWVAKSLISPTVEISPYAKSVSITASSQNTASCSVIVSNSATAGFTGLAGSQPAPIIHVAQTAPTTGEIMIDYSAGPVVQVIMQGASSLVQINGFTDSI